LVVGLQLELTFILSPVNVSNFIKILQHILICLTGIISTIFEFAHRFIFDYKFKKFKKEWEEFRTSEKIKERVEWEEFKTSESCQKDQEYQECKKHEGCQKLKKKNKNNSNFQKLYSIQFILEYIILLFFIFLLGFLLNDLKRNITKKFYHIFSYYYFSFIYHSPYDTYKNC